MGLIQWTFMATGGLVWTLMGTASIYTNIIFARHWREIRQRKLVRGKLWGVEYEYDFGDEKEKKD